jgi:uncharacterized Zn-finger protein
MQPLYYFSPLRLLLPVILSPTKVKTKTPVVSRVKCPVCLNEFKSNKGLSQHHAKTHAAPAKSQPCEVCGKMFKHKYAVKFHVRQVHDKQTQVKCPTCGKEIYNKYSLQKHVLRHH